jgi:hypothetical protein
LSQMRADPDCHLHGRPSRYQFFKIARYISGLFGVARAGVWSAVPLIFTVF